MTEHNETPDITVEDRADDAAGHFIRSAEDNADADDAAGHFIRSAEDNADADDTEGHFRR